MPLSPHEIESKLFVTTFRGFDTTEVGAFLREVAQEVRQLLVALYAADEDVADHVLLAHGQSRTAEVEQLAARGREARADAARIVRTAEGEAVALKSEAAQSRAAAVREASQLLARAHVEAEEIVRDAMRHRDAVLAEVAQVLAELDKVAIRLPELLTSLRSAAPLAEEDAP
ncbi:MAG TPA: DivIVA domain-containing protein [Acidimicrobiales bacterium]|nr:DivIVA domain-containing protein [Acidimicrobiales bacterium]